MDVLRDQLVWHCEWYTKLVAYGCPAWRLAQVRAECCEMARVYALVVSVAQLQAR
jgi:hypothetical protein